MTKTRRHSSEKLPAVIRCPWATTNIIIGYHDEEWGVPIHDDRTWFEFLTLEGAQAGLSWDTILKKRQRYKEAFAGFDPAKVARFDRKRIRELLRDSGIIRNRLKVESAVSNARAFLLVQKEFGSFDVYMWGLAGGFPIQNRWKTHRSVPAQNRVGDKNQPGIEQAWVPLCWADDLLRDDAGDRDRKRSFNHVFSICGTFW